MTGRTGRTSPPLLRRLRGLRPGPRASNVGRAVFGAALLALALAPAGTATAADDGQWSVSPVANTVGQRPSFYLAAAPGRSVADAVTLTNRTDRPRTFRLYVADAYNTARDGGFAVRGPEEPRRATAAWAKLDRERVTVAAHGSVAVGFTLTVPDRAEPGDHPGAVVALEERPAAARPDAGRGIGVQQAVAARLYLRVTGPTAPALTVRGVTVRRRGSGADISYTLTNIGNVTLRPRAGLTATGVLGRSLLARELGGLPAELLPGQEVRLSARWEGAPRAEWAEVTVRARADGTTAQGRADLADHPSFTAVAALVAVIWSALGAASGRMARMSDRSPESTAPHRAGFACFVGRPNAGKSTLTNALVGTKVAITSNRPQTTRHTVRGIVHRPDAQLVLVDTPGLHKPRTLLGERLNDVVRTTWAEVDVIGFCLPADQKLGPGDKFIAKELAGIKKTPKIAIITKTDLVESKQLAEQLLAVHQLGAELGFEWAEIVPVSAVGDTQVQLLADLIAPLLPESPPLYPEGDLTDEPEMVMVAELIREAALEGVRDELPHSIAVVVEEMIPRENRPADRPLLDIHANVYIERPSQKGIIIGPKGSRLKEVGMKSRKHIEALLGTPVFLDLHVKVAKDWQRDPKQLRKLGF
ncbi:GTP-binding protein Era [Streptomyces sp. CG 926]|nr:GTP-binding protein Era [Streptomyces sp. CG 926]